MEPRGYGDSPGRRAVSRGFSIASESDELCQPVHLLAAFTPGHLAVALIDQADAAVVRLLNDANIDPAAVRAAVLEMLGAPEGLAPVPMRPLCPAGTYDRLPLQRYPRSVPLVGHRRRSGLGFRVPGPARPSSPPLNHRVDALRTSA
jgi:hypothetical protein